MSLTVQLLKTSDAANKIDKAFTNLCQSDPQCNIKDDCSIMDPVILLDLTAISFTAGSSLFDCNYIYIPAFKRFYQVKDITTVTSNVFRVSCHVDVLKTYMTAIYSSPCIISKNANNYNLYLNDSNYKCYQDDIILKHNFPSGFDDQTSCYVMGLIGDKVAGS